MLELLMKELGI